MKKSFSQKLAVIGDPIAHSLSPLIQRVALRSLDLTHSYDKIRVPPKGLEIFLRRARKEFLGFNVTIPHKESILPLLDWVCPLARAMGAVNTVLVRSGGLFGFNTDGEGYLASFRRSFPDFEWKGKKAILLGAGGATRAIALSLGARGLGRLTLLNRTPARAEALARRLRRQAPRLPIALQAKAKDYAAADVLINTTSVGMAGDRFDALPWEALSRRAVVSDIVYRPLWTPLLTQARVLGHPVLTGEGMLVEQAALALMLWTGRLAERESMYRSLHQALGVQSR